MTKETKEKSGFVQGKSSPLLPDKTAKWVEPFNDLLTEINTEYTDHPLLKELGSRPSRNGLVQLLITIGLETVEKYHSRVFIDTKGLSQDLIDLLNTQAGQMVVSNLLLTMDGKSNHSINLFQPSENTSASINVAVPAAKIINQAPAMNTTDAIKETSENAEVRVNEPVIDQFSSQVGNVEKEEKKVKLSPAEKARLYSERSTLSP
ncbi:hypothetical protein POF51_26000 [Brevibacillus sp. AG]|uniref:hypothetical protein n=1 Tax=Brevibacillus sp. AG TaxID=3020891 RepID=UPI00232D60E6|nr:hypothetical protein [Brevibacillus sp. AG]MDC0764177.1 hypothetical protein [Brevibacillus sp. AG]